MCVACVATFTAVSLLSPSVPAEINNLEKNIKISKPCPKSKLNQIKDNLVCLKDGKKYRWAIVEKATPIDNIKYSENKIDKKECQLKDARIKKTQINNVGFPLSQGGTENALKPTGDINILFIPIDFPNIKGDEESMDILNFSISKMSEWYKFFSNNKLNMKYSSSEKWFTAPRNSYDYIAGKGNPNEKNDYAQIWNSFAQEFINSTGTYYNFNNADAIIFHFPNKVKTGLVSQILGRHGTVLNTHQGPKNIFYFGAGERSYEMERYLNKPFTRLWGLWIHELLHSHGLAIHAPGNGWMTGLGTNQQGDSLSITSAWELFLLGWLNDNQIYCLPKEKINSNVIELTALEEDGDKHKIISIPLDQYRSIVLNSRRPVGFSQDWDKDSRGILAHIVDTRLDNDRSCEGDGCKVGDNGNNTLYQKWSFYLMPDNPQIHNNLSVQELYRNYFLKKGMTLTFENVIIKVLESDKTDTVLVERKS